MLLDAGAETNGFRRPTEIGVLSTSYLADYVTVKFAFAEFWENRRHAWAGRSSPILRRPVSSIHRADICLDLCDERANAFFWRSVRRLKVRACRPHISSVQCRERGYAEVDAELVVVLERGASLEIRGSNPVRRLAANFAATSARSTPRQSPPSGLVRRSPT